MKRILFFLAFLPLMIFFGCSRTAKVVAIEGDKSDISYTDLGTLEIKMHAPALRSSRKILSSRLAALAHKRYGADAVIKVEFWPDPNSRKFPNGIIYARGEMIKYNSFPEPTQPTSTG